MYRVQTTNKDEAAVKKIIKTNNYTVKAFYGYITYNYIGNYATNNLNEKKTIGFKSSYLRSCNMNGKTTFD